MPGWDDEIDLVSNLKTVVQLQHSNCAGRFCCFAIFAAAAMLLLLQDMPGWGDEIDLVSNLKTVVQFLLEQRKKDLLDNKAGVTGGCFEIEKVSNAFKLTSGFL
jgi:hypothetical protein